MKKTLSAMLAALIAILLFVPALALNEGESRVAAGDGISDENRALALEYFGKPEDHPVLTVKSSEVASLFSGLLSNDKLESGKNAAVCVTALEEGAGVTVRTNGMSDISETMYENALMSAGVADVSVVIWAPAPFDGMTALALVFAAYADMGGLLTANDRQIGAKELAATGELAGSAGEGKALSVIDEVKKLLEKTRKLDDSEVIQKIKSIAEEHGIDITEDQSDKIFDMCRSFENLSISDVRERVKGAAEKVRTFWEKVKAFFAKVKSVIKAIVDFVKSVVDFFSRLFGSCSGSEAAAIMLIS